MDERQKGRSHPIMRRRRQTNHDVWVFLLAFARAVGWTS